MGRCRWDRGPFHIFVSALPPLGPSRKAEIRAPCGGATAHVALFCLRAQCTWKPSLWCDKMVRLAVVLTVGGDVVGDASNKI